MKKLILILLTLLAAILLPLAIPNDIFKYGNTIIGLFCISPFLYAVCRSPSYKFSLLLGVIFGATSTFLTYYWLMFFGEYAFWTIGGPILGYIIFNSILALFLHAFATGFPRQRVFALAMVWTVYEFIKSYGFLGFPWGLLAHPYHEILPLIQVADLTGVWGVSFLVALMNTLIMEIFLTGAVFPLKPKQTGARKKWLTEAVVVLSLVVICLVYGTIRLMIPIPAEKNLSILMIQQNIDPWRNGNSTTSVLEAQELTLQGMADAAVKPDIIAWSETSFPGFIMDRPGIYEHQPAQNPFLPFVREQGAYFLVGARKLKNEETREIMNASVLLTPAGEPVVFYGKQHPVPFAEKLPFWDFNWARAFYTNVVGLYGQWANGNESTLFEITLADGSSLKFGTPICFEDAFPELNRKFIKAGADLWINLTNVSWSKRESAEIQMFVASKFRAVENKRVLLRSTNSGVTSVIDPFGRTLEKLPLFVPDSLYMQVPVYRDIAFTFYTVAGDYFPFLLLIFSLAALFLQKTGLVKKIKNKLSGVKDGIPMEERTDDHPQDHQLP